MAEERAFSWDEEIEAVENEFVDIPEETMTLRLPISNEAISKEARKCPLATRRKSLTK